MGYKEIKSLDADVTISLGGQNKKTKKNNPTQVEGFFLGSREVKSPKSKSGLAFIHFFQTSKGNVGVWGKTDMDRKLQTAERGYMTLVKYEKMVPTPNGDMYKYSVAQDSDNTIDVEGLETSSGSEDTGLGNEGEYSGDTSADLDNDDGTNDSYSDGEPTEDEDDQSQALAAAEAARARKAKVQSLLNGKGKSAK